MARTAVEARIQDRTARARLLPRKRPYWRQLSQGQFLGYYRGKLKGAWIARYHCADTQAYVTGTLGEADDLRDANGRDILSYKQAFDAALHWIEIETNGPASSASDPAMTVGDATRTYVAMRDARRSSQAGRTLNSDAHYKLNRFVLEDEKLSSVTLACLSESDLRAWQLRLARKKPASIQRVVNDLKAALNAAFVEHRKALPADLPTTIKYGLKIDAPEVLITVARDNQILSDDEVRRIVAAALRLEEDFGRLVALLAATGARFSQLARMTVGDVQAEQARLMIPQSFKGRKRQLQYIRVQVGQDILAALRPVTEGRTLSAPLLEHWRHRQTGPMEWVRVDRGPWSAPSEMTRMWKRTVTAAGLPAATIPYGLRHSSIVRGLRAGLPIRLVAALHDTSVAMIERHYSRWITEGLDELVARAVVPLMPIAA
ncbi:tyrosine-type recombinase/integrase [Sphingomonas sp.]|uniref:tyrosine-type recombinase/integrase n=1 Tax=Sphingomonas sp. TaxID=28214 RepID=UPI003F70EEC1